KKLQACPHTWFMTRRSLSFPGDYVEPNNEENGRMAADFLHNRGHTSVAVITTDPNYSAVERRISAFTQRAREHKLTVHPVLAPPKPAASYLSAPPDYAETVELVEHLLRKQPRPTGLYLPVDHFCGSFFRALRDAGQTPERDFEAIL